MANSSLSNHIDQSKAERKCSVEGCEKPKGTRGLCHGHYTRWLKYGDVGSTPIGGQRPRRDKLIPIGTRYGRLVVVARGKKNKVGVFWECQCDCGTVIERTGSRLRNNHKYGRNQHCGKCRFKGSENPRWRGGVYRHTAGYLFIKAASHPNANKWGFVAEHVLVMSEHIGRPLIKGETVHHKNGIKDDNRIENLELWSSAHHPGQRVTDKIKYAIEILSLYHPEYLTKKGTDAKDKPVQNQLF